MDVELLPQGAALPHELWQGLATGLLISTLLVSSPGLRCTGGCTVTR